MIVLNNGNPKTVILNGLKIKFNKGESTQPDTENVMLFVKKHPKLSIVSKKNDQSSITDEKIKSESPDSEADDSSKPKTRKRKKKDT